MEIKIMAVSDRGCESVYGFSALTVGNRVKLWDAPEMGTVVPNRMGNRRFAHGDQVTVEWDDGTITTVLAERLAGPYN